MARKLELSFACGDYEIMRALKEGSVRPEGIELTVLTDMAAGVKGKPPMQFRGAVSQAKRNPRVRILVHQQRHQEPKG